MSTETVVVRLDDALVETIAEALFSTEYPKFSLTACRDSNRWSWRGAGEDPTDPKPAMGFLGPNGETDFYDDYRSQARTVVDALRVSGTTPEGTSE